MRDKNEDVWIQDHDDTFYHESLEHTFSGLKIKFGILQRHLNKNNDFLLVYIHDKFRGDLSENTLKVHFKGDIAAAKKMIESSLKYFDEYFVQRQGVNIDRIKEYYDFYVNHRQIIERGLKKNIGNDRLDVGKTGRHEGIER